MAKIQINLSVEETTWHKLKAELKRQGYPKGVASWLVQDTFEKTLLLLEHDQTTQLDFIFNRRDSMK